MKYSGRKRVDIVEEQQQETWGGGYVEEVEQKAITILLWHLQTLLFRNYHSANMTSSSVLDLKRAISDLLARCFCNILKIVYAYIQQFSHEISSHVSYSFTAVTRNWQCWRNFKTS
jgi:hypothetical protein